MDPLRLRGDTLELLDQTALPHEERWIPIETAAAMCEAIAVLRVRGAPAIGIAGSLAVWLEARRLEAEPKDAALAKLRDAAARIRSVRPTAVNLAWGVTRALRAAETSSGIESWPERIKSECLALWEEDRAASREMARNGASYFPTQRRFLTHCNTGPLATGGGGTALGVLIHLHRSGRGLSVWATETRPLLQGSRLTAWELAREGIPFRVVTDGAAPFVMARSGIEGVVVGADRIARNGDVANKVGTFSLALAARDLGIPFVVVAPTSTVDLACPSGEEIPIEQRDRSEVAGFQGVAAVPAGVEVENPAFDVTPARLVTAIVTERGVHLPHEVALHGVDTAAKYR